MKTFALFLAGILPAFAQITSVTITPTNTQVKFTYTSGTSAACTVEVSESPSYSPLVHDVDPTLFSGSNVDNRTGSGATAGASGTSKVMIVGHRGNDGYAVDTNGNRSSRALQANTVHYWRINHDGNCGSGSASGTFTTTNITEGSVQIDPFLSDPNAPGVMPEPTFDWSHPDNGAVDAITGMYVKMLTSPQVFWTLNNPTNYTTAMVSGAINPSSSGPWTNPQGPAGGSGNAVVTGDSGLTPAFYTIETHPGTTVITSQGAYDWTTNGGTHYTDEGIDQLTANITYTCSGGTGCSGSNAVLQYCWSVNGLTCFYPSAFTDVVSGTNTTTLHTGDLINGIDTGLQSAISKLGVGAFFAANYGGTADVASDLVTVTWTSGMEFPAWLANGSILKIGTSYCLVSSLNPTGTSGSPTRNTITLQSSCSGLAQGAGQSWSAPNFGLLLRKKTNTTEHLNISAITYQESSSSGNNWGASGAFDLWANIPSHGGFFASPGEVINAAALTWVNSATGHANFLGMMGIPTSLPGGTTGSPTAPYNGWSVNRSSLNGCYFDDTRSVQDSLVWNCTGYLVDTSINHNTTREVVFQAVYTGNVASGGGTGSAPGEQSNQEFGTMGGFGCTRGSSGAAAYTITCTGSSGYGIITWTLLTPQYCENTGDFGCPSVGSAVNLDLDSQLNTFGASDAIPFTASQWTQRSAVAMQGQYLMMSLTRGAQNTLGNIAAVDPGDSNPLHAGGAGAHVKGLAQTWNNRGGHYTTTHDILPLGNTLYGHNIPGVLGSQDLLNQGYGYSAVVGTTNTSFGSCTGGSCPNLTIQLNAQGSGANKYQPYPLYADNLCPDGSSQTPGCYGSWDPGFTIACVIETIRDCSPSTDEFVQLQTFNGSSGSATISRGYYTPKGAVALNDTNLKYLFLWPDSCQHTVPSIFPGGNPPYCAEFWWDFINDPHGTAGYTFDLEASGSHEYTRTNNGSATIINGQYAMIDGNSENGYHARFSTTGMPGIFTAPLFNIINTGVKFAGITPFGDGINLFNTHPSFNGVLVNQNSGFDGRYMSFSAGVPQGNVFTLVSGSLYVATTTTSDGDNLTGNIQVSRKIWPTLAQVGYHPLIDVSSATQGNIILDTSSGYYTYCIARVAGECRTGSAKGNVYINAPYVTNLNCASPFQGSPNDPNWRPICLSDFPSQAQAVTQFDTTKTNTTGATTRVLTRLTGPAQTVGPFYMPKVAPDGSWVAFINPLLNGVRAHVMIGKLGTLPFPATDSTDRTTFVSVSTSGGTAPAGTTGVRVRFGYSENNGAGSTDFHFCTSRQENCVVGNGANSPFAYVTTDTEPDASCSPGQACDLTMPGVAGKILYWTKEYRTGSTVLASVNGSIPVAPLANPLTPGSIGR